MASVEDLIATMNSGVHVGKQGYDLSALQAQLAKTLACNPHAAVNHTFAPYQPITGSAHIPPAPVSSLNSMASTSFNGTAYAPRANGRPMPTPQASFTGFDAPLYGNQHASGPNPGYGKSNEMSIDEEGDMEMEMEDDQRAEDEGYGWVATGFQPLQYQQEHQQPEIYDTTNFDMSTSIDFDALNQMSPRSRARPRAAAMSYADDPPLAASDDDFSAFASDAFAPAVGDTYSSSADSNHPQSGGGGSNTGRSGVGGVSQETTESSTRDGWEAFRRHNKAGAASAFAITPTNRTAPASPVVNPMRMAEPPASPWSGRLRSRGSE